jgi:exodeoxyribonuclease V alpha subunit
MLRDNNKSFILLSPTGKASKVLAENTREKATTIHRGLCYIPPDEWGYNKEQKLNYDIVIIDEFSMVDIFLFARVIDAIDFTKTKLLMIGDNAQLPSVSCGNLLHDFMQSNLIPTITLTKVFRYSEGGLMRIATDTRCCKPYLTDIKNQFTYFGDNKDYAFIAVNNEATVKSAVSLYEKLLKTGYKKEDIQVLTSYKKGEYGSVALNNHIQKIANPNYGNQECMKVSEVTYFQGDLVIQNVNNYHAELFITEMFCFDDEMPNETFIANGETGVITEVYNSYVVIDFDGVKVKYSRNEMQMCGLGYSISIHKSQGSSIKVVILITPKAHTFMLNSNLIYVGLTRMKEKCFHLGNIDTVNSAVKKKENLTRNTFMQELLKSPKLS